MEAFNLGDGNTIDDAPSTNGDRTPTGSVRGRIKGLNKWTGGLARSASGQSTNSSKGKGKSSKKGKGPRNAESDGSVDGDEEDMADGAVEDDDDDYVVRTDHLANPMEVE
jgi:peroxin-6